MGFGQYSDRMLRTFKDATLVGLEIDRSHIYGSEDYFHKVHSNAHVVIGDIQVQPLAGQQFDLVLTVDVMEHVEDDKATFAEFHRVLKPGGYLVMHTPRVVESDDAPPLSPPAERGGMNGVEPAERGGMIKSPNSQGGKVKEDRWRVDEHVRDGYRDYEARERIEYSGMKVVNIVRGYGWAGHIAWTLLQRIPLSWMSKGRFMILPVILYLALAFPAALCFMWLDMLRGDDPKGGSLLVIAQRPEEG